MSRKQGIIHLGPNKSPHRFRATSPNNHQRVQSMRTSRSKEPLQQNSLNHSMHVVSQPHKPDTNHAQTYSGFWPPNPRTIQQVVVKQNMRYPQQGASIQASPHKRVIVSRPLTLTSESSPSKNQSSQLIARISENQAQLQRKIKVLEARVQQLHQEKQNCVMRSHEESKKLAYENSVLQNRLNNIEGIKNQEINGLRQEITSLRNASNSHRIEQVEVTLKPTLLNAVKTNISSNPSEENSGLVKACLKNAAYVDDEENINNQAYKQSQSQQEKVKARIQTAEVLTKNLEMEEQIKTLTKDNSALKAQINDLKDTLLQSSAIIQENNKKIIQNYDSKILSLQQENKSNVQQISKLTDQAKLYKDLTQQYVQKALQKSQQVMRVEDLYKGKTILLKKQVQGLKQQLAHNKSVQESIPTESQTEQEQKQPPQDSCTRCKDLIKTLVKLNQKAFSKTS